MTKNNASSVEKVTEIGGCEDFSLVLKNKEASFIAHFLYFSKH